MKHTIRTTLDELLEPSPPARRWAARAILILLAVPLLLDGGTMVVAGWQSRFGPVPVIHTPTFDMMGSYLGEVAAELNRLRREALRRMERSDLLLGVLLISLAGGSLLLHQRRLR